jgi:hypothetical protein
VRGREESMRVKGGRGPSISKPGKVLGMVWANTVAYEAQIRWRWMTSISNFGWRLERLWENTVAYESLVSLEILEKHLQSRLES